VLYSPVANSLTRGTWFKLICGASFGHLPAIRNLAIAYTLAGADCIDIAADPAVIAAARAGIKVAQNLTPTAIARGYPANNRPWLMVSLNDGTDPHFRKAEFDAAVCPIDCPRPCERICPAEAIVFEADRSGVIESRCYGCGRCVPICPVGLITTADRTATLESILPALMAGEIDAIEIHTQSGHLAEFGRLWEILAPVATQLKLLSISCPDRSDLLASGCPDSHDLIPYLRSLHATIAATYHPQPLPFALVWQTDGRPMSGDIGVGTTHAAIGLGKKVLAARLPGYVQLAGGTNHYTVPKLRECGLLPTTDRERPHVHGVAYGSYARVLLSSLLDRLDKIDIHPNKLELHPELLWSAVAIAHELVGQLKSPQTITTMSKL
jgi:Fe-S-cluster-containing hydrogenase component 2